MLAAKRRSLLYSCPVCGAWPWCVGVSTQGTPCACCVTAAGAKLLSSTAPTVVVREVLDALGVTDAEKEIRNGYS
jgi:hypothetical protein